MMSLRFAASSLLRRCTATVTCPNVGIRRPLSITMNTENINLSVNEDSGVATLNMCHKPVNTLSLELFTDMKIALEKLEKDKQIRALVIGSDISNVFCAGVDINEMYKPNLPRLEQFWRSFQSLWIHLYGSRLPIIASISDYRLLFHVAKNIAAIPTFQGNSPAGGTILAMSCDYRIMADGNFTIGLNGSKLGIATPSWFRDTLVNTVGQRHTELILQLGQMYDVHEALKHGLIDMLVPLEDLQSTCNMEALKWANVPETPRILTKEAMRRETINRLEVTMEHDLDHFINMIMKTSTQLNMKNHLEALKNRK